jgi:hypothetical protein
MNPKDTREMRETGSQAKGGDREEERLNESQGYNRKERDRLAGKGETERTRDKETYTDERDRLAGKGGRQRRRETE